MIKWTSKIQNGHANQQWKGSQNRQVRGKRQNGQARADKSGQMIFKIKKQEPKLMSRNQNEWGGTKMSEQKPKQASESPNMLGPIWATKNQKR